MIFVRCSDWCPSEMRPEALKNSDWLYAVFDGCPTCGRNARILDEYRTYAQAHMLRLRVLTAGSHSAMILNELTQSQPPYLAFKGQKIILETKK